MSPNVELPSLLQGSTKSLNVGTVHSFLCASPRELIYEQSHDGVFVVEPPRAVSIVSFRTGTFVLRDILEVPLFAPFTTHVEMPSAVP